MFELIQSFLASRQEARTLEIQQRGVVGPLADDSKIWKTLRQLVGGGKEEVTEPYAQSIWVYASVHTIAQNIAQVPQQLLEQNPGDELPKPIEEGDKYMLFLRPNPLMTGPQLIESTFTYWELYGEVFWALDREDVSQWPKSIWCLDPTKVEEIIDEKSKQLLGWKYKGVKEAIFASHEIIHFKYFNPYNPLRGLSPLQAAKLGVDQDYFAAIYNRQFFKEGVQVGGWIQVPQNMNDKSYNRLLNSLQDRHAGYKKAHRFGILEQGATFAEAKYTQRDMEFIQQQKLTREQIFASYKINSVVLGLYDDVKSYEGIKVAQQTFWRESLLPKIFLWEESLWSQLFIYLDNGTKWLQLDTDSVEALRDDFSKKVDAAQILSTIGYPINMINQRLNLGMESVAWGNTAWMQTGMVPVELLMSGSTPPTSSGTPKKTLVGEKANRNWRRLTFERKSNALSSNQPKDVIKGFETIEHLVREVSDKEIVTKSLPSPDSEEEDPPKVVIDFLDPHVYQNSDEDDQLLQRYLIDQIKLERLFESKIKRFLFEQRKNVLEKLLDHYGKSIDLAVHQKDLTDAIFDESSEVRKLTSIFHNLYGLAIEKGATSVAQELGQSNFVFQPLDAEFLGSMELKLRNIPPAIIQTLKGQLQKTLTQGISSGDTVTDLAQRIRRVYNMAYSRALTIARTESGSAMSAGRYGQMKNSRVQMHRWLTASDEHVRISHRVLNGAVAKLGEPFPGSNLRYPGDMQAPAGEVINCRCVTVPLIEDEMMGKDVDDLYPEGKISDISSFPKDFKEITPAQFESQAKLADIVANMQSKLKEIASGEAPKLGTLGSTQINETHLESITKTLKTELKRYTNYLAGDTTDLMRDFIEKYESLVKKAIPELKGISATKIEVMGVDMVRKLVYQEIESVRQQFTDHGIRHLMGNVNYQQEFLDRFVQAGGVVSGRERLMGTWIMINHDVGYTTPLVREGGLRGVMSTKLHQSWGAKIAEEQRAIWDMGKIFTPSEWSRMVEIIRTHDSTRLDTSDMLATTTRISDNLSLFNSKKIPSVFKYVQNSEELLSSMMEAAKLNDLAKFESLRVALTEEVNTSALSPQLKRDFLAGVKEISMMTPKFTLGVLAGDIETIATSAESLFVVEVRYNKFDAFLQKMFDMGQSQTKKFLKDYGIEDFSATKYTMGKIEDKNLLEIRIKGAPEAGEFVKAKFHGVEDNPLYKDLITGKVTINDYNRYMGQDDKYLSRIAKDQGFDSLPKKITPREFEEAMSSGKFVLYRGVKNEVVNWETGVITDRRSDYIGGSYFAGRGVMGSGTYTAYGANGLSVAEGFAQGQNGQVIRMVVKDGARVITLTDLEKKLQDYLEDISNYEGGHFSKLFKLWKEGKITQEQADAMMKDVQSVRDAKWNAAQAFRDNGRFAAALGYDVIDCVQNGYMIVLNRSAVNVVAETGRYTLPEVQLTEYQKATLVTVAKNATLTEQKLKEAMDGTIISVSGVTPSELEAAYAKFQTEDLEIAKISFLTPKIFRSLMKDSRFKNQFELGKDATSEAYLSPYKGSPRDTWEKRISYGELQKNPNYIKIQGSGYFPEDVAQERPVYGYMGAFTSPSAVTQYGDVVFVLKPGVTQRASFSVRNSSFPFLNDPNTGRYRANLLDLFIEKVHGYANSRNKSFRDSLSDYASGKLSFSTIMKGQKPSYQDYTEAQVYGGIDISRDVKEIRYKRGNTDLKRIMLLAEKFGIPLIEVSEGGWSR